MSDTFLPGDVDTVDDPCPACCKRIARLPTGRSDIVSARDVLSDEFETNAAIAACYNDMCHVVSLGWFRAGCQGGSAGTGSV